MDQSSPTDSGTPSIWTVLGIPNAPGQFSAAAGDAGNSFGAGAIDGAVGELQPFLPYLAIGAAVLIAVMLVR